MPEAAEKFEFGPFVLEPERHRLSASGRPVTLQGRAFDVLELLVRERERVLSHAEILKKVWGGQAVDPRNLTVQISALRTALAAHAGGERLIHTIPNRGYRFIGEVEVRGPAPPKPPPEAAAPPPPALIEVPVSAPPADTSHGLRRSTLAWSAAILALLATGGLASRSYFQSPAAVAPRFSIAVLPFRNAGPDRGQDYLADAVTDDLISDLAHIPGSTVIARETTDAVKTRPPQRIGRELHVRYVLAGTLAAEEGKYYVTAHLIDTDTGAQAGNTFQGAQPSLSLTRNDVVHHLAHIIQFELDRLESSRSLHDRPDNPDALDLFFRARALLDSDDSADGLSRAQDLLERALKAQPDFADAGAALGWLLIRKVLSADDDTAQDRDWVEAGRVIDQTLRLAPRNALAISAMARKLFIQRRYAEAQATANFALSIEASGLEARWVLVNCAWMLGDLDAEARGLGEIAALNPDGIDNRRRNLLMGEIRLLQMRPAEAIEHLLASISGDPEPQPGAQTLGRPELARLWLIAAYVMNKDVPNARALYDAYNRIWPNRSVWRIGTNFPRPVGELSGAKAALQALGAAGMAQVGDPATALSSPSVSCGPDPFDLTPTELPGGRVIDTADVVRMLGAKRKPIIIDIGTGSATIPTARWFDPGGKAGTSMEFVLDAVSRPGPTDLGREIIVAGDGVFGCSSYTAASLLVARGHTSVFWYRGGEEAWANRSPALSAKN